jgi:hypothetical protein
MPTTSTVNPAAVGRQVALNGSDLIEAIEPLSERMTEPAMVLAAAIDRREELDVQFASLCSKHGVSASDLFESGVEQRVKSSALAECRDAKLDVDAAHREYTYSSDAFKAAFVAALGEPEVMAQIGVAYDRVGQRISELHDLIEVEKSKAARLDGATRKAYADLLRINGDGGGTVITNDVARDGADRVSARCRQRARVLQQISDI